jgi:hypothetical protein
MTLEEIKELYLRIVELFPDFRVSTDLYWPVAWHRVVFQLDQVYNTFWQQVALPTLPRNNITSISYISAGDRVDVELTISLPRNHGQAEVAQRLLRWERGEE